MVSKLSNTSSLVIQSSVRLLSLAEYFKATRSSQPHLLGRRRDEDRGATDRPAIRQHDVPRGGVGGGGRGAGGAEVISHVVGDVFYSVRELLYLSGTSGL